MSDSRKVLLAEKVYQELKDKILNGEYLPGMRLVEAEQIGVFKVSRATLREALRRLNVDGLVDIIPNTGVRVRKFTYKDAVDIHMVREIIEVFAARLAAESPVNDLKKLKKICSESASAVLERDRLKVRYWNTLFHHEIASLTGNKVLIETLERLNTQVLELQSVFFLRDVDLDLSQRDHEEILEAISLGNGDAAEKAMRNHIRRGRDFALSNFPGK